VVFEHAFWGWTFILVGSAGLCYSIWERLSASMPGKSNGVWIAALLLTWALLGFDFYDRHYGYGYNPDRVWNDNAPLKQVNNRNFRNETLQIDGVRFFNCSFDHVTFSWRGTGRFDFVESRFLYGLDGKPTNSILSKNLVVNLAFALFNNMLMPSQRLPKEILEPSQVLDGVNK
jgi:hypothetical protein